MADRLERIKERWSRYALIDDDDAAWLIAEMERLREDLEAFAPVTISERLGKDEIITHLFQRC